MKKLMILIFISITFSYLDIFLNERAPLIMWLPGGPGWSVLYDALKQNGPFRINH